MRATTLVVLVLVLLTGALGCGGSRPLAGKGRVLVRMTEWQLTWFEGRVQDFARPRGLELGVESYQLIGDVEEALVRARRTGGLPLLVKVEERMVAALRDRGLIRPLESVVDEGQLAQDLKEYSPEALDMVRHGGKTWGLPRKLETMVLAYRKTAVRQAVSGAAVDRARFLAAAAGAGLPLDADRHSLDADPADWDLADLMEVGHYLARVPMDGVVAPRFYHRTARIEGTPIDLACLSYPFGYAPGRLEEMPGFEPMVRLERFAFRSGVYPPMDPAHTLYTPQLYEAWKRGQMHLAYFQQVDATRLVGATAEGPNFVQDRGDVGFVSPPRAGVLAEGTPEYRVPSGGWAWCLPAEGPAPELGYALGRWITSAGVHREECRRFGMMPIRADLAADLPGTFPDPVVRHLMEVSFATLEHRAPKPALEEGREAGRGYDTWAREVAP